MTSRHTCPAITTRRHRYIALMSSSHTSHPVERERERERGKQTYRADSVSGESVCRGAAPVALAKNLSFHPNPTLSLCLAVAFPRPATVCVSVLGARDILHSLHLRLRPSGIKHHILPAKEAALVGWELFQIAMDPAIELGDVLDT